MTEDRRANPALLFLKQYWFLICFTFVAVAAVARLYFSVEYIQKAVNPDAVVEWRVEDALFKQKNEIRWCLQKANERALAKASLDPAMFMECAD